MVAPLNLRHVLQSTALSYTSDKLPGYSRVKKGKGFVYQDSNQKIMHEPDILTRLNHLKIPPAWKEIWISPDPNGHIQVTGRDEKNRKVYLYHPLWIKYTQQHKFENMAYFGDALPEIRKHYQSDLTSKSFDKDKVLATILWFLDHAYMRIGNQEYAKNNEHFGLTTLRDEHVNRIGSNLVTLSFIGKSGKEHQFPITNRRIARIVRRLEELPGQQLFQYHTATGGRSVITSTDVNEYLRHIAGEVTAKDFRTWGGTVLSGATLVSFGYYSTLAKAKQNLTQMVKTVARSLHNTPAVTRKYYIHPLIPARYLDHTLLPFYQKMKHGYRESILSLEETMVHRLLKENVKQKPPARSLRPKAGTYQTV